MHNLVSYKEGAITHPRWNILEFYFYVNLFLQRAHIDIMDIESKYDNIFTATIPLDPQQPPFMYLTSYG